MPLDADSVGYWIAEYLGTFAACARGEADMATLLNCYGVPLIVTSDDGVTTLMTDDEAAAVIQSLIDGLRANGYHHTEVLQPEVVVFNSTSAMYRAVVSRRNSTNDEIDCLTITYVVIDDVAGPRIVVLASHGQ